MKNRKRLKSINGSQSKLTLFQRSLPFGLSGTAIMALYYSSQGLNQKAISEQLGCSPANVSKVMKKLKTRGLLITQGLTRSVRGAYSLPFDVRFRSLKWKLTHPINLHHEREQVNSGVKTQIWKVKGATVRQNIGKRQFSLEIECGYTEGSSMAEVCRRHDAEALNIYDWLVQHYPELAKESARLGYEVNRKGEVTIPQMKEFAEKWLETHPRLDAGLFKIDDSLKNGGEFQIKLDYMATKDDFEKLRAEIGTTNQYLIKVADSLTGLYSLLKRLIEGNSGTEGPVKPMDKSDEGMYR